MGGTERGIHLYHIEVASCIESHSSGDGVVDRDGYDHRFIKRVYLEVDLIWIGLRALCSAARCQDQDCQNENTCPDMCTIGRQIFHAISNINLLYF